MSKNSGIRYPNVLTIFEAVKMAVDKIHTSIRRLRESKGLSQSELAQELGMGRTTYVNFETGKTNIFCKSLTKFARYFGLSEEDVLLLDEEEGRGVLREEADFETMRQSLVEDYEKRLAAADESLKEARERIRQLQDHVQSLTNIMGVIVKGNPT